MKGIEMNRTSLLLMFALLVSCSVVVTVSLQPASAAEACSCTGYDGPGGSCYDGPGGPMYAGPGGPAYDGPGGPCYAGPGGHV